MILHPVGVASSAAPVVLHGHAGSFSLLQLSQVTIALVLIGVNQSIAPQARSNESGAQVRRSGGEAL
jgi:predicted phage tail protein